MQKDLKEAPKLGFKGGDLLFCFRGKAQKVGFDVVWEKMSGSK